MPSHQGGVIVILAMVSKPQVSLIDSVSRSQRLTSNFADVVHTICYSILLLNTDLHLADIESRMTRSQFVKNTLPTVVRVCKESLKDAEETLRPHSTQMPRGSIPWNDKSEPTSPAADATTFPADVTDEPETKRARSRLSVRPPPRSGSEPHLTVDTGSGDCNALVNSPYQGPIKGWEYQMQNLKFPARHGVIISSRPGVSEAHARQADIQLMA